MAIALEEQWKGGWVMKRFASVLRNKWNNYKYRFVPWQILNWQDESHAHGHEVLKIICTVRNNYSSMLIGMVYERMCAQTGVKRIEKSADFNAVQEDAICENLKCLFETFHEAEKRNKSCDDVLFDSFGFNVKKRASSIKGAGNGVFVSKGVIPKNAIAAMYPGTIYYPSDPLLFQSIINPFILRCIDGLMIDGNHKGISRLVFRSCSGRDMIGPYRPCDTSWLADAKENPLAVGQFVNNHSNDQPANVAYQEVNIPISFPLHLRKYLPNIYYCNRFVDNSYDVYNDDESADSLLIRVVVLVSIAEIKLGEELFSSYFTEVF